MYRQEDFMRLVIILAAICACAMVYFAASPLLMLSCLVLSGAYFLFPAKS
jgi:hypothetical protein